MLNIVPELNKQLLWISNYFWVQNYQHYISWLDKSITYSEQTWLLECRNDFWRNVLPNMLLLGQNAVLVVKKTLQNFYQCSFTILNVVLCYNWSVEGWNCTGFSADWHKTELVQRRQSWLDWDTIIWERQMKIEYESKSVTLFLPRQMWADDWWTKSDEVSI